MHTFDQLMVSRTFAKETLITISLDLPIHDVAISSLWLFVAFKQCYDRY